MAGSTSRLRRRSVAAALLCLCASLASTSVSNAALPEYEVKAALLLKIAKFVSWPANVANRSSFGLCVIGPDPFGTSLDSVRNQKVAGRRVEVLRLQSADRALNRCNMAFVTTAAAKEQREILDLLATSAVLTVSDQPDFARNGGMIGFATRDRKIAFEINTPTYQKAGLEINSQLLRLATLVVTTSEARP